MDVVKFRNLGGDDFRALAAEAKRRGILLVGHSPGDVNLAEASDAGMASIEHGETIGNRLVGVNAKERAVQFARLARNGTMITPTLIADYRSKLSTGEEMRAALSDTTGSLDPLNGYVSRSLREMWQFAYDTRRFNGEQDWATLFRRSAEDLRAANRAGVQMMVGADLGVILVYPGSSVHDEMALMVKQIGMSPAEVLRAATLNPARGQAGERKYFWSNFPPKSPLSVMAEYAHRRHWIEQYHEEAKGELGWDQYQGWRWDGFHRQALTIMLSFSFLVWLEWRERQKQRRPGPARGAFSPSAGCPASDTGRNPSVHRRVATL